MRPVMRGEKKKKGKKEKVWVTIHQLPSGAENICRVTVQTRLVKRYRFMGS